MLTQYFCCFAQSALLGFFRPNIHSSRRPSFRSPFFLFPFFFFSIEERRGANTVESQLSRKAVAALKTQLSLNATPHLATEHSRTSALLSTAHNNSKAKEGAKSVAVIRIRVPGLFQTLVARGLGPPLSLFVVSEWVRRWSIERPKACFGFEHATSSAFDSCPRHEFPSVSGGDSISTRVSTTLPESLFQ